MPRILLALLIGGSLSFTPAIGHLGAARIVEQKDTGPTSRGASATPNPVYTELTNVKLGPESSAVQGLVLKRDAATFRFISGRFFFLSPVAGKVTGAVFLGDGEFQLEPVQDIERRHLSILTKSPTLTDRFTKMTVRFTDSTYQAVKERFGVQTDAPAPAAQGIFDYTKKDLRKGKRLRFNVDARILIDLLGQGSGLFQAFFSGKEYGDMFFGIDPLGEGAINPEETVLAVLGKSNKGVWYGSHLADHCQTAAAVDENHSFIEVRDYNIDAKIKGKTLEATVRATFKARVDGARVIPLDLFPKLRVRRVSDASGLELSFIQDSKDEDSSLFVILPEGLKKGNEYNLKFEYGGDGAVLDSGGNYMPVDDASQNWYPINDASPNGDRSTFAMTLRVPRGLVMVATGQPVAEREDAAWSTTEWKSQVAIEGASFNYGKFHKSISKDDKTGCVFESYMPGYLREVQKDVVGAEGVGLQATTNMMNQFRAEAQVAVRLYTDMFGPLPYGRLAMTQQTYFDFGEASPMLVFVPALAYLDPDYQRQLGLDTSESFVKIVGPHEVAHQWWGCLLGAKSYRDQWMVEGFADFSAALFAEYVYKNDLYLKFWREQRDLLLKKNNAGKRPVDVGGVCMGYRLDTPKTGDVSQAILYSKGAMIVNMLRRMMWDPQTGDQRFSEMMKDFVKTNYNADVSTQDFQRMVEKHMTSEMDLERNRKMDWFFREWVYGTAVPDYKLDYRVDQSQGKFTLIGNLTQANVDDSFKMRVPIYADMDGRVRRLASVGLYGNSSIDEFRIELPSKPRKVMLCHLEDVLCTTKNR
jgi:hypothetical protein